MKTSFVIAIDVSSIYTALGGNKSGHKAENSNNVIAQAKRIIDEKAAAFDFAFLEAEFTDDGEFMCATKEVSRFKLDEGFNLKLNGIHAEIEKRIERTKVKYGTSIEIEVDSYIDNAKNYYRTNFGGNKELANLHVITMPGSVPSNTNSSSNRPVMTMPAPSPLD